MEYKYKPTTQTSITREVNPLLYGVNYVWSMGSEAQATERSTTNAHAFQQRKVAHAARAASDHSNFTKYSNRTQNEIMQMDNASQAYNVAANNESSKMESASRKIETLSKTVSRINLLTGVTKRNELVKRAKGHHSDYEKSASNRDKYNSSSVSATNAANKKRTEYDKNSGIYKQHEQALINEGNYLSNEMENTQKEFK